MTFAAAMDEAEIESACCDLGMSVGDTARFLVAHRSLGDDVLRAILARGFDYSYYVQIMMRAGNHARTNLPDGDQSP